MSVVLALLACQHLGTGDDLCPPPGERIKPQWITQKKSHSLWPTSRKTEPREIPSPQDVHPGQEAPQPTVGKLRAVHSKSKANGVG